MECGRLSAMRSFVVMDVLERAQAIERQGHRVIHLEVGEPDFDTPEPVKEAAIRAIREGRSGYTHSLGIPELREAVCALYEREYGVSRLSPEQVVVTSGSSPGILMALSAIMECGAEAVIPDPGYACYRNFVRFLGGEPKFVPVYEEDGFALDPAAVREAITERTAAVFVCSPGNPTGTVLPPERMAQIANLGPWVISDEIYHGLVYGGRARSMLEFTDRCVVVNGFSKRFAMTGWRLGYIIVPKALIPAIRKMAQNFFISPGSVAQWAGLEALANPEVERDVARMRSLYDERRRFIVPRLREIGFGVARDPEGAFYVLANASRFTKNAHAFAFEVLEGAHVGITPGTDFGERGEGFVRFSYANSLENIAEGLSRIERFLADRGKARP